MVADPLATLIPRVPKLFPGCRRPEAEAAVVAACLFENDNLPECTSILPDPSAFEDEGLAAIWRVVLDRHRAGERVDALAVSGELTRAGRADMGLLTDGILHDLMMVPSGVLSWQGAEYAAEVRDAAALRAAIDAADQLVREAAAGAETPTAIIERAIDRLRGAAVDRLPGRTFPAAELVPEVMDKLQRRRERGRTGVPTGFAKLDDATDGFQPGELVLLAARPSVGKTSMALNVADHAAIDMGMPVLFVSLEMGNPSLVERMLAARAMVPSHVLRCGQTLHPAEADRLMDANAAIGNAPLYLVRRPGRNLLDITNEVRRAKARHGLKLVIIDYLQLIQGDNPRDNETAALTKISAAVKNMAVDIEAPVVALSQLNRDLEKREDKSPKLADLRGSGALEQDADLVLFIHRPGRYDPSVPPSVTEVDLAKNRNGKIGVFRLEYTEEFMRFRDAPPETPNPGVVVNETPF